MHKFLNTYFCLLCKERNHQKSWTRVSLNHLEWQNLESAWPQESGVGPQELRCECLRTPHPHSNVKWTKTKHRIWPYLTTYSTSSLTTSPWLSLLPHHQITRIPANSSPCSTLDLFHSQPSREILFKRKFDPKSDHITPQHILNTS